MIILFGVDKIAIFRLTQTAVASQMKKKIKYFKCNLPKKNNENWKETKHQYDTIRYAELEFALSRFVSKGVR